MDRVDRQPIAEGDGKESPNMSDELVALLRHRVATGFYAQPAIVDALARIILRERSAG
jgi:hypothetical protein